MNPVFTPFTEAEHRHRLDRARASLRAAGFDACVSVAAEHQYYLGGYDSWLAVNSPQALVFMADGGEPTLVVRDVDLSLALETTWIEDIRTYHLHTDDAAGLIAAVAREKGLGDGRVAVEILSHALPHALGNALATALAPARMEDGTELLGELRLLKDAREMAYIEEAAGYAAIGLDAARRGLSPGITEIVYAGRIEAAMREAGSDFWAIPTELTSGSRTAGGHGTPRERVIKTGDLVHFEFAGVSKRYHATAIHTIALGEPGPRAREIYDLTRASLTAGAAAVKTGAAVHDIEVASLAPLLASGMDKHATMRFGYGIGLAYPPLWLETLQISRGFDRRMEVGMVFVLHACIELVEEGLGVILGGTYVLEESGLRLLAGGGDVALEIL